MVACALVVAAVLAAAAWAAPQAADVLPRAADGGSGGLLDSPAGEPVDDVGAGWVAGDSSDQLSEEASQLDDALDAMLESADEEDVVELLLQETDPETVRLVTQAMERRLRRSAYRCDGQHGGRPFCRFLREYGARFDSSAAASARAPSHADALQRPGPAASTLRVAGSGAAPPSSFQRFGSSGSAASLGSSRPLGASQRDATPRLEPSYSHGGCQPPVTHVVREAVEYLPRTVYNTQHLLLPSTRLLTMLETELYPRPVYVTVTRTLALPDLTVTTTVLHSQQRTLDVNQVHHTEVLLHSTKLHIFTDTKDYFWTRTEYQPYYVTRTEYITSDVPHQVSNRVTQEVHQEIYVTRTVPHVLTETRTSTGVTRVIVTETAHQYRYVTVTLPAVTVARTVSACYDRF